MFNLTVGIIMHQVNRISSVSELELIELRSTLHALSNKEFSCSSCKSKYRGRSDFAEMTLKQQKNKGCFGVSDRTLHKIIQDDTRLEYSTCIGNFFSYSALKWIGFYNHFENGTMPFDGGYMDQPSKLIDVMGVVGSHKMEQIKDQANKQRMSSRNNVRKIRG